MKTMWLAAMTLAAFLAGSAAAESNVLQGSWKGPWYIGMSSGMVTMEIAADGSGKIALTNLDEFGAQPVALAKQSFDGDLFRFSATGANGARLTMSLRLAGDGRQLRGNGKHGDLGARLELQRAD
jgi:hypothetical protein